MCFALKRRLCYLFEKIRKKIEKRLYEKRFARVIYYRVKRFYFVVQNYSFALLEKMKSVSSGYNYKFAGTVTVYKNNSIIESVDINSAIGYY
jgi:hypothetical protein